jgi:hypothetical protein
MADSVNRAYFLWVGSSLPDAARISVLSAANAGFETVLFADRPQDITHTNLRLADWREIDLPWSPEQVRLKGKDQPYFAGFADLFRYTLLSSFEGWWFDCDTIILRPASDFAEIMPVEGILIGQESKGVFNNAVIGSRNRAEMVKLKEAALPNYPISKYWGQSGPALITRMIASGQIKANVVGRDHFYPVHHTDIAKIYLPAHRDALREQEPKWFCLSLWGEVLSRSGLKHLAPPPDSYLADLLARLPMLGSLRGNEVEMAQYLSNNLRRLDDMESGRRAFQTLVRKAGARLIPARSS